MFKRDRTTQGISCNSWSTRFHPYPSLICKMKTYLELEGKLGPKPRLKPKTQSQPSTIPPSQSNKPLTRETPGPKMAEKKRRTRVLAKRRYKVGVIAQPISTTPMSTAPVILTPTVLNPTVAATSTQTPVVKSAAMSILVTVYNLAKGKFDGVPYQSQRP